MSLPESNDPIRETLKTLSAPEFSPTLHHRVMNAVQTESLQRSRQNILWAAAAMVLMTFGLSRMIHLDHRPRMPSFQERVADAEVQTSAPLAWLMNAQKADGSWKAEGPQSGTAYTEGLTGLAVLALLQEPTPSPPQAAALARAAAFLNQSPSPGDRSGYNRGLATLALLELQVRMPEAIEAKTVALRLREMAARLDNRAPHAWEKLALARAEALGWIPGTRFQESLPDYASAENESWWCHALTRAVESEWETYQSPLEPASPDLLTDALQSAWNARPDDSNRSNPRWVYCSALLSLSKCGT